MSDTVHGVSKSDLSFPAVFDATMLRTAKNCLHKFYWEFIRNKVATGLNPDLNAGAAYARAHEYFRKAYYGDGLDFEPSYYAGAAALIEEYGLEDPPEDSPKQLDRMLAAYKAYYRREYPPTFDDVHPHIIDGQPLVEFSFAEPIEDVLHPETGEPILYAGTYDMMATHAGMLWVFDDKTTKQMGITWADQWKLRSQFLGYIWGAQRWGYDVQGYIVRGTAIQKTQIKFAQAKHLIPSYLLDTWYKNTVRELQTIVDAWKEGYFDFDFDDACSAYGGCQFLDLCSVPNPDEYLRGNFEDRKWNPVKVESF